MPLFWISKSFVSHIEEEVISLPKFSYCICTFLLLSRFQPIFVSFVAISAFVWRCFKAMSLFRIVPSQDPQIRSCIPLMMDIIKPGSHMPLPYLWHSCWYCLGYCSDKKKHWSPATLVIAIFTTTMSAKFTGLQMLVAHVLICPNSIAGILLLHHLKYK